MGDEDRITPEVLGKLEGIIDRDGLLTVSPQDQPSERSEAEAANPADPKENQDDGDDLDSSLAALLREDQEEDPAEAEASADPEEPEAEAQEEAQDEAQEDHGINSLSGLAEEFEVEESELLETIMVDTGSGAQIPLGDAISGFQRANLQMAAFRQDLETKFQAAVGQKTAEVDEELKKLAATANLLAKEAQADFDVDWESLKLADPERYISLRERKIHRDQILMGAVEALDRNASMRSEEAKADLERAGIREADLLAQKRPELVGSREKTAAFAQENTSALEHFGFDDPAKRLSQVIDHRELLILNAAAKYVALVERAEGKSLSKLRESKGLKRSRMVNRRTARVDRGDPKVEARRSHASRLKKSGSVSDGAALIETFLKPV